MSFETALQAALLSALAAAPGIAAEANGVFVERPVRATPPWIELGELIAADWSTKDARGREVRIAVTVRDLAESPARLLDLLDAAGEAIAALPRAIGGWRLGAVVFLRARTLREPGGQWLGVTEWRLRAVEQ
jgi:hypothetical protein